VTLTYVDIVLVLVVAALALALGAPALGVTVGVGAWMLVRGGAMLADKRIAEIADVRRRLGYGVALGFVRVWVLAAAIILAGVASSRADGLTAALVIFGAFSVFFACSAIAHIAGKKRPTQ
jgi:hypothetical protein